MHPCMHLLLITVPLLLVLLLMLLQVRIAGDSKSTDTAFCVGYKPDHR